MDLGTLTVLSVRVSFDPKSTLFSEAALLPMKTGRTAQPWTKVVSQFQFYSLMTKEII